MMATILKANPPYLMVLPRFALVHAYTCFVLMVTVCVTVITKSPYSRTSTLYPLACNSLMPLTNSLQCAITLSNSS